MTERTTDTVEGLRDFASKNFDIKPALARERLKLANLIVSMQIAKKRGFVYTNERQYDIYKKPESPDLSKI